MELEEMTPGRMLQLLKGWLNWAQIDLVFRCFIRPDNL
jgi:hypothetical protein